MFCKTKSLIKAFEKAGFTVIKIRRQHNQSKRENGIIDEANLTDEHCIVSYKTLNGQKFVEWSDQDGLVPTIYCGSVNETRFMMDDYFPGSFARTIKEAVEFLQK